MNGKYLVDTNAVINILKMDDSKATFIDADSVFFISIISEIELLSYAHLSIEEEKKIRDFLFESTIINIDIKIKDETIRIKKIYNLKLPDAVICATAYCHNLTLITDDKTLARVFEINLSSLKKLLY